MSADASRRPPYRRPPRPDRIRRITGGFAFVPNEFLHHGFFVSLGHTERSLYFFLALAGDRNGVSFYAHDRICAALELALDDYLVVRDSLIDMDLIAFDGTRFQVLSLPPAPVVPPPRPLVTQDDFEDHDPATIRASSGRPSTGAADHRPLASNPPDPPDPGGTDPDGRVTPAWDPHGS